MNYATEDVHGMYLFKSNGILQFSTEMCQIEINKLARGGMLTIDENTNISPTCLGQLMARFYLFFDTMKLITQVGRIVKIKMEISQQKKINFR